MIELLQVQSALLFGLASYFAAAFIQKKSASMATRNISLLYVSLAVVIVFAAVKLVCLGYSPSHPNRSYFYSNLYHLPLSIMMPRKVYQ